MNSDEVIQPVAQQPPPNLDQIIQLCTQQQSDLPTDKLKSILLTIANTIKQLSNKPEPQPRQQIKEQKQQSTEDITTKMKIQFGEQLGAVKENIERQLQKIRGNQGSSLKVVQQSIEKIRKQTQKQLKNQSQLLSNRLTKIQKQLRQQLIKNSQKITNMQQKNEKNLRSLHQILADLKQTHYKKQNNDKTFTHAQKNTNFPLRKGSQAENQSKNKNNSKIIKQPESNTQSISDSNNLKKQTTLQSNQDNNIMAIDWVDSGYSLFKSLVLDKNKISTKQRQGYVFGKNKLRQKNQYSILINVMNKTLMIGIVDRKLKNFPVIPINRNIIYYASDGHSWQGKEVKSKLGSKLREGQIVTVNIDFNSNTLSWKVDGQLKYSCVCDQISDKGIDWMPYIFISPGDSVSVIQ